MNPFIKGILYMIVAAAVVAAAVVFGCYIMPLIYELVTAALPKACELLDISDHFESAMNLFLIAFWAKVIVFIVKIGESIFKIYNL